MASRQRQMRCRKAQAAGCSWLGTASRSHCSSRQCHRTPATAEGTHAKTHSAECGWRDTHQAVSKTAETARWGDNTRQVHRPGAHADAASPQARRSTVKAPVVPKHPRHIHAPRIRGRNNTSGSTHKAGSAVCPRCQHGKLSVARRVAQERRAHDRSVVGGDVVGCVWKARKACSIGCSLLVLLTVIVTEPRWYATLASCTRRRRRNRAQVRVVASDDFTIAGERTHTMVHFHERCRYWLTRLVHTRYRLHCR